MKFNSNLITILLSTALLVSCSGSKPPLPADTPQPTVGESQRPSENDLPSSSSSDISPPVVPERTWTPKFVSTGFSSGIMLEFTGMKKDATLHARFASIELQRLSVEKSLELPRPLRDPLVTMTATINDLRQAFFKIAPGRYQLRQTKEWADQTVVNNVEVREGSYSVVQFEVNNPRSMRSKQLPDPDTTQ